MGVSVTLTPSEQKAVLRFRKNNPQDRPRISGRSQPISEDFEAFIILSSVSARAQLTAWINLATQTLLGPITRNFVVLTEILPDEQVDTLKTKAIIQTIILPFNLMKQALAAGKFAAITEVQEMFNDIQATTDGISNFAESIQYNQAFIIQQLNQATLKRGSAELQELYRSYVVALDSYIANTLA